MRNKFLLFFAIILAFNCSILAQISEGGTPPSFKYSEKNTLKRSITIKEIAPLRSIAELKEEDEQVPKMGYPQRIGTEIPINIDLLRDGTFSELDNGDKIVRYTMSAPNAVGLMLYYSDFYVPEGGKLFIYSGDKEQIIGAFTHETNPQTRKYATEVIYGDQLTLEYLVSKISDENPRIKIDDVSYIYSENIANSLKAQSQPCMIDINCAEGANWQIQKQGVVKITMKFSDGTYVCSGSLVNNTSQDKTPYILTAYHCFFTDTQTSDPSTSIYIFNYEREVCKIASNNKGNSITGATLKAKSPVNGGSDAALVQLNMMVPDQWKPHYNGWDASAAIPSSGVAIHHPNGDLKKISTYTRVPAITGNVEFEDMDGATAPNSGWKVVYSSGLTQGGSSGCPLFNEKGLIIGTLSGGSSECDHPTRPDYYGRLFYHWDQHTNTDFHFKKYLAPNSDVKILKGMNFDGTSIEEEFVAKSAKSIVVFPSPVVDELNVNCNEIIREIKVVDMAGKQIFNLNNHDSSTIVVPSASWASGVYSIVVTTSEGDNITEKVIKQ